MKKKSILITIDVEDWFQVENLRPLFPPSTWNHQKIRVENNTYRILNLLDSMITTDSKKHTTLRATFFVLGWVAKKAPQLVKAIHQRGHEVASHGYGHMMCNQIDIKDLEKDLIRSKQLLEDITGSEVKGYRAPNFSINDRALRAIQAAGYTYDSSFNNFSKHGRYGRLSINSRINQDAIIKLDNNFYELPISNLKIANQIIPWGGGGYFRLMPFLIFKAGIQKILKKQPAYVFYLHPWEIDPNQPKVKESKGLSGWRHYLNLNKTYSRLTRMIETFKNQNFITCKKYIESLNRL